MHDLEQVLPRYAWVRTILIGKEEHTRRARMVTIGYDILNLPSVVL